MALLKPNRFIGDRAFYKTLIAVALPIMLQNGITEFVSLLDNVMIGHVGTEEYNAVVIVNQLVFVYMVCVFGSLAGAGIFSAQFYGNGDDEGVRNAFRFKLYAAGAVVLVGALVFGLGGESLISLYLHDAQDGADLALVTQHGLQYLHIIMICMIPHALSMVYASTLRETGKDSPKWACVAQRSPQPLQDLWNSVFCLSIPTPIKRKIPLPSDCTVRCLCPVH